MIAIPSGFRFSGVHAGIKGNRKDLAMVASDTPCVAAGCFTASKARAAPVLNAEPRLPASGIRAVVINSGNANALTGKVGLEDVQSVIAATAAALKVAPESVLTASTGVIGQRLPANKIIAALPALVAALGPEAEVAAQAMMTTDTKLKVATVTLSLGGAPVRLTAICKGSGMIHPELATMIAVIATDADLSASALASALREAMKPSFNCLTVDGDMSTNDTVFALANGRAGNEPIVGAGASLTAFTAALTELCKDLAKQIAADGEGATKLLEICVRNAPDTQIAQDLARAVALSSLVKAAIFGADPNWGRILAAIGARAGTANHPIDPSISLVTIQDLVVYDNGPAAHESAILKSRMRAPEVRVEVDLRSGASEATAWGCDLSYDYVKINADYSSMIVHAPDGGVAKDNRLTNYSPAFKANLLVEALGYISRFAGKRCVIKYGGAAMVKDSLKHSFCDDVNLLRSVGLKPIVVHGGGPEITRTLEKMGSTSQFIDGQRVTHASDLKTIEMVLTGSINTELVTILNRHGAHAVGASGKDGALLRARKQVREDGRDLGQVGEITRVSAEFLEMLLKQDYVPVISPVALGEDGQSYNINADTAAAEIAAAIGASKLIYLSDVPGILDGDDLVSELTAATLEERIARGVISGGMVAKARSILLALGRGVERVHLIDGRVPHSLIAELFTDHGIGTLVTAT